MNTKLKFKPFFLTVALCTSFVGVNNAISVAQAANAAESCSTGSIVFAKDSYAVGDTASYKVSGFAPKSILRITQHVDSFSDATDLDQVIKTDDQGNGSAETDFPGPGKYAYKIYQQGAPGKCALSKWVTVTMPDEGAPGAEETPQDAQPPAAEPEKTPETSVPQAEPAKENTPDNSGQKTPTEKLKPLVGCQQTFRFEKDTYETEEQAKVHVSGFKPHTLLALSAYSNSRTDIDGNTPFPIDDEAISATVKTNDKGEIDGEIKMEFGPGVYAFGVHYDGSKTNEPDMCAKTQWVTVVKGSGHHHHHDHEAPDTGAKPTAPYQLEVAKDTVKPGETVHIKGLNLLAGRHIHLQVNGEFCFHGELEAGNTVAECDYKVAEDAQPGVYKVTLESAGQNAESSFKVVPVNTPATDPAPVSKTETPEPQTQKQDLPKDNPQQSGDAQPETLKKDTPAADPTKAVTPVEPTKVVDAVEPAKSLEPVKSAESTQIVPAPGAPKAEQKNQEAPKQDATKETPKAEVSNPKPVKTPEDSKADVTRVEAPISKPEAPKDAAAVATVDKPEYVADDEVHYVFKNLTPNAKVKIELHSQVFQIAEVFADANGQVSGSFKLPTGLEAGLHHLIATDATGKSVQAALQVTAKPNAAEKQGTPGADPASVSQVSSSAVANKGSNESLAATGAESPYLALGGAFVALLFGAFAMLRRRS